MLKLNFARLERASTQSFITIVLPEPMIPDIAFIYCNGLLPDWEYISGSIEDPDVELKELEE